MKLKIFLIWHSLLGRCYKDEPKYRKYVKGYGFLSFLIKFGHRYGKTSMDTATKTGSDAAKTSSKRVV